MSNSPQRVRCFLAVDVGEEARRALRALLTELRRVDADVRWVGDGALHVTLKFLGGVAIDRLDAVRTSVRAAVEDQSPPAMEITGTGAFPSWRRPRVLWAGVHADGLEALARRVDEAVTPLGFVPEERPFHPHVTLGRARGQRGLSVVCERLQAEASTFFGRTVAEGVVLFRSETRPGGASYTPLWTIPMGRG